MLSRAILLRILLATIGGYACAALGVGAVGTAASGNADAVMLAVLLAFPVFAGLIIWTFAARRLLMVAATMAAVTIAAAGVVLAFNSTATV